MNAGDRVEVLAETVPPARGTVVRVHSGVFEVSLGRRPRRRAELRLAQLGTDVAGVACPGCESPVICPASCSVQRHPCERMNALVKPEPQRARPELADWSNVCEECQTKFTQKRTGPRRRFCRDLCSQRFRRRGGSAP